MVQAILRDPRTWVRSLACARDDGVWIRKVSPRLYRLGAVAVLSNNTEAFRQAAEKNRLAAGAPQKAATR